MELDLTYKQGDAWPYPPNHFPQRLFTKRKEAEGGSEEVIYFFTNGLVARAQELARVSRPAIISAHDHLLSQSFHQRMQEVFTSINYVTELDAELRESLRVWTLEGEPVAPVLNCPGTTGVTRLLQNEGPGGTRSGTISWASS